MCERRHAIFRSRGPVGRPPRGLPASARRRDEAIRAGAGAGQPRAADRGKRPEGAVAPFDGAHRRRACDGLGMEARPLRRRVDRRRRLGPRRDRHARRDGLDGRRRSPVDAVRFPAERHADLLGDGG